MTSTERSTFEPDGRAIPYADEGSGPVLVLLPGSGLDIVYLGTLAHVLVEEDFRVIRIGSRHPRAEATGEVTLHDLAQDVADVLDHVGVDSAWIGGHAFGGSIARVMAHDHHDRVNGVLLLAVDSSGAATDETWAAGDDATAALVAKSQDADVVALHAAAIAATEASDWETPAAGVPVLAIIGTADTLTPSGSAESLRNAAPELVSVVSIEGAGHLFPATHAGETSWAIEDYLDWD